MSRRTVVHLLRHGEVHNPSGVLYGRLPGFRLSADGERMAQNAADWLAAAGADVATVIASPLERAQQTAGPLAAAFGVDVQTDHRVIESANIFEGTTIEFSLRELARPTRWHLLYDPFTPSWGEPFVDISARVLDAVDDARASAHGREAVIVSHQLPIWTTRRRVEGRRLWHRPDRRQCALGSLTSLVYAGDTAVAVRYVEPSGSGWLARGSVGA